jgi:DNA-binding NtrC family response regulator
MVAERLAAVGFGIETAEDGIEALERFAAVAPQIVVSDLQMPRLDGLGLLRRVRAVSNVPIVIITAFGSISVCEEAMRLGASRFLQLGRDLDLVGRLARELVEARSLTAGGGADAPGDSGRWLTAEEARALGERELRASLVRLLIECRGNIAEMARRMGRDRSTVRYHLRRMGLLSRPMPGPPGEGSPDHAG